MPNKKNHLSFEERFAIEKMLKIAISPFTIAVALDRGKSTIIQEINRNGAKNAYNAIISQSKSDLKQGLKKEKLNKVELNEEIKKYVDTKLAMDLSPEAISFLTKAENKGFYASPKSIRKYIKYKYKH